MDILFLSSDLDSPRARVQPADGRRGLRDLIASFGQNIVTVPSETTHVWVKFDRDHACRDPVDTCLSCCGLRTSTHTPMTLRDSAVITAAARNHDSYPKLTRHLEKVLPEGVMLSACYEDVIDDIQGQARRLIVHGVVRVLQSTRS